MEFRRVLFRSEAYRNFPVAERLTALVDYYRSGVRQLAALTRPDVTAGELEAYVDIMMACFFGLGQRTLIGTARDVEQVSHETACLLMRALGAAEQPPSASDHRNDDDHKTSTKEQHTRRQEERRVGTEWDSTNRSRRSEQ